MTLETVQRVRIYVNERDRMAGQPLYEVVLDRLRREGATGATAIKGVAGFGAGRRVRGSSANAGQAAPIVIEWVDRAERVGRLLPQLDELLPDALVTIDEVRLYRAVMHAGGPFGDRLVGELVDNQIVVGRKDTSLADAYRLLLKQPQPLLPLLNADRVIRVIAPIELERLAGAGPSLRLLRALNESEREAELAALPQRSLGELAERDPRAVSANSPLPLAVRTMVEWSLEALPVVDRDGRFIGLFSVDRALQAALEVRHSGAGDVRDSAPPVPLQLLMQHNIPTVAAAAPAANALAQLLAAPHRFLVVISEGKPLGLLRDAELAAQLAAELRDGWLVALRGSAIELPATATDALTGIVVSELPLAPVPSISAAATRDAAIRRLLDENLEWLVVIDDNTERAVGLIGRNTLLRSLAQESNE